MAFTPIAFGTATVTHGINARAFPFPTFPPVNPPDFAQPTQYYRQLLVDHVSVPLVPNAPDSTWVDLFRDALYVRIGNTGLAIGGSPATDGATVSFDIYEANAALYVKLLKGALADANSRYQAHLTELDDETKLEGYLITAASYRADAINALLSAP